MRAFLLATALLLLSSLNLSGQERLKVIWKSRDGSIDTARLNYYQLRSPEDFLFAKIIRLKDAPDRYIKRPGEQLEWAIHDQDTVITTHSYRGRTYHMQLLYTGEVKLYRAIAKQKLNLYFLVRNNKWYQLTNNTLRENTYAALRQNCKSLHFPRRLRSTHDAIELCRQINHCLGIPGHRSYFPRWSARNEISLNVDILANASINGAPFSGDYNGLPSARFGLTSHTPAYQRAISVSYYRRLFRYRPSLVGQLQGALISFRADGPSFIKRTPQDPVPAYENIDMSVLYLDPGLEFRTGYRKQVRLLVGAGLRLVVPLYSYRRIELTDPNQSIPSSPIVQETRNLINPDPGYFIAFGLQFALNKNIELTTRFRNYQLRQHSRYYRDNSILHSTLFPDRLFVAPRDWGEWQFQLRYSW